jgi:hypothetical protein
VRASLLAIAVSHSANVLTETPKSPAGWLPQLTELNRNKKPADDHSSAGFLLMAKA